MEINVKTNDDGEKLRAMLTLELFLKLSAENQNRVIAFLENLASQQ